MADRRVRALPTITLPAGTPLHHGTRCVGDFMAPDGPAWFAFSHAKALEWASWSQEPPKGRRHGPDRVLPYALAEDLVLLDTRTLRRWQAVGSRLVDDPDPLVGELAAAVRAAGYRGWLGGTEVMLCDPAAALVPEHAPDDVAAPGPRR